MLDRALARHPDTSGDAVFDESRLWHQVTGKRKIAGCDASTTIVLSRSRREIRGGSDARDRCNDVHRPKLCLARRWSRRWTDPNTGTDVLLAPEPQVPFTFPGAPAGARRSA